MARRFFLEYDVEVNGKKVKILGISHGQTFGTKHGKIPITPVGPITAGVIMSRHQQNRGAAIYSEDVSRSLLPFRLIRKARPLLTWEQRRAVMRAIRIALGGTAGEIPKKTMRTAQWKLFRIAASTYLRELVGLPKPIDDVDKISFRHLPDLDREKAKATKHIITYLSLQMADTLLTAPAQEIISVMGAGHAPLVKKFLENPKLRERYRKLWEKAKR